MPQAVCNVGKYCQREICTGCNRLYNREIYYLFTPLSCFHPPMDARRLCLPSAPLGGDGGAGGGAPRLIAPAGIQNDIILNCYYTIIRAVACNLKDTQLEA